MFYHHQNLGRESVCLMKKNHEIVLAKQGSLLLCCGSDGDAVREALPSMNVATTLGIKLQARALISFAISLTKFSCLSIYYPGIKVSCSGPHGAFPNRKWVHVGSSNGHWSRDSEVMKQPKPQATRQNFTLNPFPFYALPLVAGCLSIGYGYCCCLPPPTNQTGFSFLR